ncbi:hypothetical protein AAF143_05670 [Cyanobium sp. ATX-6F1]|uniref:hypothetical protein n=1 Tax=Cyanobium sp. ATX 6F1 TaxID=2823702 RepID=UPI0020CD48E2|nr:hypothetical protein [Cyanobium sp. ATX 6F1]MCP9916796.1 hypothetical protein [Cyanobium sp. ATX 6F1]
MELFSKAQDRPPLSDYSKRRILIASSILGNVDISSLDICLGIRLQRQGASVAFLICDGSLSACALCEKERFHSEKEFSRKGPGHTCAYCSGTFNTYIHNHFQVFTYMHASGQGQSDIEGWVQRFLEGKESFFHGVPISEHVRSGLIRFYGKVVEPSQIPASIVRRFAEAACQTVLRMESILEIFSPEVIVVNHGLYVPQGVIVATAHAHKIRVVTWHKGYRRHTMLLSHGDTYHRQLIEEENSTWENYALSENERLWLANYMTSRRSGEQDWISFVHKNAESKAPELSSNIDGPLVSVLTNVDWDAQAHFSANTYSDMKTWLQDIGRCAEKLPGTRFVVRIHPAEVTGRRMATTTSADELRETANRCTNLSIISADQPISTYQLLESSDLVIVYATKTAVEAAYLGKPVLICGESCLRGKNVGRDLQRGEDLPTVVKDMLENRTPPCQERAERYAFHLFRRRMIEWELLTASEASDGEKAILDGIAFGSPFHAASDH